MALDAGKADLVVGVLGAGSMGRGIMQVAAAGGLRVLAFDAKPGAAAAARAEIVQVLDGLVAKGRLGAREADAAVERIGLAPDLAALARADLVVEAIVEKLDVKQSVFAELDALAGPDTILATNTSSLPVTAIAAHCARPERVAGLHFFNPVPLMKLVEVIPGLATAPAVTEALTMIARRMTREPVLCADSPGFIVNHIGRAYVPEAARILSEGIADYAAIDRIMTGAPGMRMGPFALLDLVGADVSVTVMESLWGQFYGEPMYAPQALLRARVDAGRFGRKTGQGWYRYIDGKRIEPEPAPAPGRDALPRSAWVVPTTVHGDVRPELVALLGKSGVAIQPGERPGPAADLVVVTPLGYSLVEAIEHLKLEPARTVAVDLAFGLKGPRTLMVSPATAPETVRAAHAALAGDGAAVEVVNDSPGFVAQRLVAHIVNVGCQIAQRAIATPADIDTGGRLGLSYPHGPLEWGDRLGAKRVLHILERLHAFYGEPRYRPSPWLKRRAALGLPLTAPERRT
jgi:3-hydroxybutyryl-CoA dehydrogenase